MTTGTSLIAMVPLRSAARISASVKLGALVFEVLLHQLLVGLGDGFEQLVAHRLGVAL